MDISMQNFYRLKLFNFTTTSTSNLLKPLTIKDLVTKRVNELKTTANLFNK